MLIGELFKNNWPERLVGMSIASLVFLIGHLQIQYADKFWYASNQDKLRMLAISQGHSIEQSVHRSISGTSILAGFIEQQNGYTRGVESTALTLSSTLGGTYQLERTRSGAIEETIEIPSDGLVSRQDLFSDEKYLQGVVSAVDTHQLNLVGPFDYQHSGAVMIAIQPVIIAGQQASHTAVNNAETATQQQVWGVVSTLIDLDDLMSMTGLKALKQRGIGYQLMRQVADNTEVISNLILPPVTNYFGFIPLASANQFNTV